MVGKRKSKLLFDARLVLGKPTGIGQYIASLLPELLRLAPDWHFHLLRGPHPWSGYDLATWDMPNLTHHVSAARPMTLRQHIALPRLAERLGVDLLHYPHFDAPVWWQPVPVVATLYDAKYLVRPDFFTRLSAVKRAYMRASFAATLRRAAVLTISEATACDLRRLFRVPPGRLHVAPLAAAPHFSPASEEAVATFRQQYSLDRPFVLSVGELRPHKNHRTLLEAFAQSRACSTHDLVIIGQRHGAESGLRDHAEALAIGARLHLLTDVDEGGLVAAYTAADVFALVSLYEGFGLPVLEAMACGTPVIASNTTALGEVTGAGGVQVDPTDPHAIAEALDALLDPAVRQHQREHGHQWLTRWSWEATAHRTLAVYESARSAA